MSFVYESGGFTAHCMQWSRKWVLPNWIGLFLPGAPVGGVLSGKVGTGDVHEAQIGLGCLFGLWGLPMAPFYLKIGLDIGRDLAKCFGHAHTKQMVITLTQINSDYRVLHDGHCGL